MIEHPFPPCMDADSRILILGSFPSEQSRKSGFYYGNPRNRFFRVLSSLWNEEEPQTVEERRAFLLRHHIALWDVLASCEIRGSADSTIRHASPNDLSVVFRHAAIRAVYTNGKTAENYYQAVRCSCGYPVSVCLPSSSPANAAYGMERLTEAWRQVKETADISGI